MIETFLQLALMAAIVIAGFVFIKKNSHSRIQRKAAGTAFGILAVLIAAYAACAMTQQPWVLMVALVPVAVVVPSAAYLIIIKKGAASESSAVKVDEVPLAAKTVGKASEEPTVAIPIAAPQSSKTAPRPADFSAPTGSRVEKRQFDSSLATEETRRMRPLGSVQPVKPEPQPQPKVEVKPKVEPRSAVEPKVELQPKVEFKPEPKPELAQKPKPKAEPKPEPQLELKSEPKPELKPEYKPELTPVLKPELKPEPKPKPKPEPKPVPKPEPKPAPMPESQPQAEAKPKGKTKPNFESKTKIRSKSKVQLQPEPQQQPQEAKRERYQVCVDNAAALREKGLHAAAATLYEKAAALGDDEKQARKMRFNALACYLKAGDYGQASKLAEALSGESDSMSNMELVKLEAVLSSIEERVAR